MSVGLFPIVEVPDYEEESVQSSIEYKSSVAWDMKAGDFVRNGANQILSCDGKEAFKVWCHKTAKTERFVCLSYPDSLGTEMDEALREESDDAVEAAIERTITEALMANPCTELVNEFVFEWDGDSLKCSFVVKGINLEEFSLSITMNGQEVEEN